MVIFTFSDIMGLATLGFFVLFFLSLLLHRGCKVSFLEKAGFPKVHITCETALHCRWYECGYCTKPDFNCQFNPKRPVSESEEEDE